MGRARVQEKKPNEIVEGYRIMAVLGHGAASIVYLVQDPKTKGIWALKHVVREGPKDQRFLDQAESEYEIAKRLDHPTLRKIPTIVKNRSYLIGSAKELFLVMEFLDGKAVDQHPPRNVIEAVEIFLKVAEGMAHMHDQGYVHADMKPNNIIIDGEGHVKIIDLGQACKIGTVKERIQGTPDYIAPEQVHRQAITPKTDVYNLGATMYWCLVRKPIPTALAKDDKLVGSLDAHMVEKAPPVSAILRGIHPRLNDLVMQCVEPEIDKRPESMRKVANELSLILGMLRADKSRRAAAAGRSRAGVPLSDSQAGGSALGMSGMDLTLGDSQLGGSSLGGSSLGGSSLGGSKVSARLSDSRISRSDPGASRAGHRANSGSAAGLKPPPS
jgi:eukaryotic-like serine/threonine-protein kinase